MGYLRSEVVEKENIDVEMKTGGEQGRANVVDKKDACIATTRRVRRGGGGGVKHPPLDPKNYIYIYIQGGPERMQRLNFKDIVNKTIFFFTG